MSTPQINISPIPQLRMRCLKKLEIFNCRLSACPLEELNTIIVRNVAHVYILIHIGLVINMINSNLEGRTRRLLSGLYSTVDVGVSHQLRVVHCMRQLM